MTTLTKDKPKAKQSSPNPPAGDYTAAEIRSGFFVTFAAAALLGLLFMSGHFQLFSETYEARILFNYISGLAKNAPVHFAGHEVGKVTNIQLVGQKDGQVAVTVRIDKSAVLRKNSQAFIDLLGFMGEKFVELTPGTPDSPPLQKDDALPGSDPVAMNELMEKGTDIADELQKTTVSLQGLIKNIDQTVAGSHPDLEAIFQNLNSSSQNLKEMTSDLKLHPWKLLRKSKEDEESGSKKKRLLIF